MAELDDARRERRISELKAEMVATHQRLQELQQALMAEINARSPEQVARMEQRIGLAS